MKKQYYIIVFFAIAGAMLALLLFIIYRPTSLGRATILSRAVTSFTDTFIASELPEIYHNAAMLNPVNGIKGNGTAVRQFRDNTFVLRIVLQNIPAIKETQSYRAWLIQSNKANAPKIFLGTLERITSGRLNNAWVLVYLDKKQNLGAYQHILITKETNDRQNPEIDIFEGKF